MNTGNMDNYNHLVKIWNFRKITEYMEFHMFVSLSSSCLFH